MKRATFDILDAAIPDDFTRWQTYPDDTRFMPYRRTFLTDPVYWERHKPVDWAFALAWNELRYADIPTPADVDTRIQSDDPGLYIFYARPPQVVYRFPQFAFYLGISNEGGSNRPLRERLKDYVLTRVAAKLKRDSIDQMLQMYYGVLWVAYTLIPRTSDDLRELETKLHGFIYPCYSRRDFPDDIRTQQRRFGGV
jgi:hypothetical protein